MLKLYLVVVIYLEKEKHKILQFIKENQINENIIIYGLDADLIMLAMAIKCSNIYC